MHQAAVPCCSVERVRCERFKSFFHEAGALSLGSGVLDRANRGLKLRGSRECSRRLSAVASKDAHYHECSIDGLGRRLEVLPNQENRPAR
jgi:hypothetical protein